ncbi:hypothetical protein, partial [uncultured Sphingomonas sp.]|uniref:hypothetical protein n=1 Tax=uncultured Sphingomonas sp. TaxID=158754 RepID=UPI002596BEB7
FSWSSTIRTARARTSGENLFVVLLVIAPSSQELEPPTNPARFTSLEPGLSRTSIQVQPFPRIQIVLMMPLATSQVYDLTAKSTA